MSASSSIGRFLSEETRVGAWIFQAMLLFVVFFIFPWDSSGALLSFLGDVSGWSALSMAGECLSGVGDWRWGAFKAFGEACEQAQMLPAGVASVVPWLKYPMALVLVGLFALAVRVFIPLKTEWNFLGLMFSFMGVTMLLAPMMMSSVWAKDPYFKSWVTNPVSVQEVGQGERLQVRDKTVCEAELRIFLEAIPAYGLTINGVPAHQAQCGMLNKMHWVPKN